MRPTETSFDLVSGTAVVRTDLRVDRNRVWEALTTQGLAGWLGRPDGLPQRMGARFRLAHDPDTVSTHRVTLWRPRRLLGWAWQFPDEDDSLVTFRLVPIGTARSVLTVEHRGLGPVVEYAAGWQLHLDRLAAHLLGEPRSTDTCWAEHAALVEQLRAADGSGVGQPPAGSRRVTR